MAELGESGQEEAINEVQWPQLVAASTVTMPYQLVAPATVTVSSTPINMMRKASPLTVGYDLNLALKATRISPTADETSTYFQTLMKLLLISSRIKPLNIDFVFYMSFF